MADGKRKKPQFKVVDNPNLAVDPAQAATQQEVVARLNRQHVFIDERPNGILVVPNSIDKPWRMITVQGFHNKFANRFMPIITDPAKPHKFMTFSDLWFQSSDPRQYAETGFWSLGAEPSGCFNMYRGLRVVPAAGAWAKLRDFLRNMICSGVEDWYNYLLDWEAWKLQNPTDLIGIALVLVGPPGIGKGYFGKLHARMFGAAQFIHYHQPQRADARFNGELESVLYAMYDEVFISQSRLMEASLKGRITEDTVMIEHKGVDAVPINNKVSYIFLSNEDDALPFKPNDRRFLVLKVSDARQQDEAYFDELDRALATELPAFVFDMLARDVSGFNRRRRKAPPMTPAKLAMSFGSAVSHLEAFLLDKLRSGRWPGAYLRTGRDAMGTPVGLDTWATEDIYFSRAELHAEYRLWVETNYPNSVRSMITSDQLAARIGDILKFDIKVKQTTRFDSTSGRKKNAWGTPLPSLPACRAAFMRYLNCAEGDIDWQAEGVEGDGVDDEVPF
jgi:hypothetical protein